MSYLGNEKEYGRYYGSFRGVDFSSDHTQVDEHRFAYLENMYKDHLSGRGQAVETIPGFRRRVELPGSPTIWGIHRYKYRDGNGREAMEVLLRDAGAEF